MKNITLSSLFKPVTTLFRRFHMTLFVVLIAACLGLAVVVLNTILDESSTADGYTSPTDAGSIDQPTLDRIKALHTSKESFPKFVTPPGRTNPFAE